jgi:hypothetical protein
VARLFYSGPFSEVPKIVIKNVIFWLKISNFSLLKVSENGIPKAQGPQKKSGGLHAAMSAIEHTRVNKA